MKVVIERFIKCKTHNNIMKHIKKTGMEKINAANARLNAVWKAKGLLDENSQPKVRTRYAHGAEHKEMMFATANAMLEGIWRGKGLVDEKGNPKGRTRHANGPDEKEALPPGIKKEDLEQRKVNYEGEIILSSGIFYLFTVRNPELKSGNGISITVENSEGMLLDNLDKKLKERSKLEI